MKPILPVGFCQFHKNKFYNYQLNRLYSLGNTRLEDIQKAATRIDGFDRYQKMFAFLDQKAVKITD
jgi:hypothetical protein